MISLDQFIQGIAKLKRANTNYGKAPHKPILLLTLIELIDKSMVAVNAFRINADFGGLFQDKLLVTIKFCFVNLVISVLIFADYNAVKSKLIHFFDC